jgi:hypothetical protein
MADIKYTLYERKGPFSGAAETAYAFYHDPRKENLDPIIRPEDRDQDKTAPVLPTCNENPRELGISDTYRKIVASSESESTQAFFERVARLYDHSYRMGELGRYVVVADDASETCLTGADVSSNGLALGSESEAYSRYISQYLLKKMTASECKTVVEAWQAAYRESMANPNGRVGYLSEAATKTLQRLVSEGENPADPFLKWVPGVLSQDLAKCGGRLPLIAPLLTESLDGQTFWEGAFVFASSYNNRHDISYDFRGMGHKENYAGYTPPNPIAIDTQVNALAQLSVWEKEKTWTADPEQSFTTQAQTTVKWGSVSVPVKIRGENLRGDSVKVMLESAGETVGDIHRIAGSAVQEIQVITRDEMWALWKQGLASNAAWAKKHIYDRPDLSRLDVASTQASLEFVPDGLYRADNKTVYVVAASSDQMADVFQHEMAHASIAQFIAAGVFSSADLVSSVYPKLYEEMQKGRKTCSHHELVKAKTYAGSVEWLTDSLKLFWENPESLKQIDLDLYLFWMFVHHDVTVEERVIKPAVLDEEGKEVTPAVIQNYLHLSPHSPLDGKNQDERREYALSIFLQYDELDFRWIASRLVMDE